MRCFLLLLAVALVGAACEEDMGQDSWVTVDNRTDQRLYVDYEGATDDSPIGWVEAGESARVAVDACASAALEARAGAVDGPVVAMRSEDAAQDCVETWVVEP